MKSPRTLLLNSLLAVSLLLTACGESNASTSATEVVTHFMDSITTGTYEEAKAYIAPEYREDEVLASSWNNQDLDLESYDAVAENEPSQGYTIVSFTTAGTNMGVPYSSYSSINAAEIDGVWWIVPYGYTPAE